MKIDFFKVVAIIFLIAFFSLMVYYGFKEPPQEIIEEVKKTNPVIEKKIDELLKENDKNFLQNTSTIKENNTINKHINNTSDHPPNNTTHTTMQSVNEIVEKNKRVIEMIYTYKEFQINYLRYQQVTSGEKFPQKGQHLKIEYEQSFQKLLSFNTEEDYKFLIDQALNEWRPNVKNYFFNKLSETQSDIKDKIILEKLPKLSKEENVIYLLKGLSKRLSPESKERLLNALSKIRPEFDTAKKEIQNIVNKQQ